MSKAELHHHQEYVHGQLCLEHAHVSGGFTAFVHHYVEEVHSQASPSAGRDAVTAHLAQNGPNDGPAKLMIVRRFKDNCIAGGRWESWLQICSATFASLLPHVARYVTDQLTLLGEGTNHPYMLPFHEHVEVPCLVAGNTRN